jgi:hypothetical protein
MKKLQINIFNNKLEWVGMVDAVESLVHRTSWHEISNSELKVGKKTKGVNELQIGRILLVNNRLDKALIIEEMEASLDDNFWIFNCIPLKAILNYRICHPTDSGTGWTNARQSTVMRELVRNNLVTQTRQNARKFLDGERNLLRMGAIKTFGDLISFSVNWETGLLGDTITNIAKMYGDEANYPLGWNIIITNDFLNFEFDVWHGTHRTMNQTSRPPVVFSEEFGNIKNATYTYSIKDWRNVAYIKFTDASNVERTTDATNTTRGAAVGFNRKEFLFSSSGKVTNEARNEGQSEMNKRPHVESFVAEIINNENTMTTFEKDWFLGDIVTVQSKEIAENKLLSVDAQITEIEEIYDNGLYSINATFGEGKLSIFQLIKNAIK